MKNLVNQKNEIWNIYRELDENELKVLIDLFNTYDTHKTGKIKAENLYEVASILGKDAQHGNKNQWRLL